MNPGSKCLLQAGIIVGLLGNILPAGADTISPNIHGRDRIYSTETPNYSYYGTGMGGRIQECSMLRYEIEQHLADRNYETAIKKSKRACQFDPSDPSNHLCLARSLTMKFYNQTGEIDEKLLRDCLREWQLIRYHDADRFEQVEAMHEAKKLLKISKLLEKEKKRQLKQEEQEQVRAKLADKQSGEPTDSAKDSEKAKQATTATKSSDAVGKIAEKRKRFVLF